MPEQGPENSYRRKSVQFLKENKLQRAEKQLKSDKKPMVTQSIQFFDSEKLIGPQVASRPEDANLAMFKGLTSVQSLKRFSIAQQQQ